MPQNVLNFMEIPKEKCIPRGLALSDIPVFLHGNITQRLRSVVWLVKPPSMDTLLEGPTDTNSQKQVHQFGTIIFIALFRFFPL